MAVGVIYGGRSGEHDVSLCSAASVVSALDENRYDVVAIGIDRRGVWHVQDSPVIVDDPVFGQKLKLDETGDWLVRHYDCNGKLSLRDMESGRDVHVDVVFPVVHGTFCEDGTLQGLLELSMVPFVGADTLGSAVGMDKDVAKRLLRDAGIPVVPWIAIDKNEWQSRQAAIMQECREQLGPTCFVKPANAGSSVGVTKITSPRDLKKGIEFSLKYDTRVLVEKAVDAREIECAVLGNHAPVASVPGEIVPNHEFYSYEAKYIYENGASVIIPAPVDEILSENIKSTAVRAFCILRCSGMARVDFFVEKNTQDYFLNEINTLPGFTSISMYPKLWGYSGISYPELIDRLISLAIERNRDKISIKRDL